MDYIDIEDYKNEKGEVDFDRFNADLKKLQKEQYDNAIETLPAAQKLAKVNGFDLQQHSPWHFSLNYIRNGKRLWRINIFPSNQRLWSDPKCGKAPFLDISKPWTFLDIVSAAIIQSQMPPKKLIKEFITSLTNYGCCSVCEQPLLKRGGYAGTGMCGPCATGEASTLDE